MRIRVCIADARAVFRAGVREVLQREKDFEVVEAQDLSSLGLAVERGVDVLVVDKELPPAGAGPAIVAAKGKCREIVVWSFRPEPEDVLLAVRAGATGYLRKEISPVGLVRSLRGAAHGESVLARDLAALMIEAIHNAEARSHAHDAAAMLSSREREVLGHVARGSKNKQIAVALSISEFTVKRHVQNILRKLDIPSRRAAASFHMALTESKRGAEHRANQSFAADGY